MPPILRPAGEAKLSPNCQQFLHFVRGFSAQIVVIGHAGSIWGVLHYLEPPHMPYMQNVAVLAFFVVSGLVITYSASNKIGPSYSFSHYFRDRFARIYCGLFPALLFVAMADLAMLRLADFPNADKVDIRNFVSSLLLTATYPLPFQGNGTIFGTLRPLWTLVVEWWIYIAFGVLLTHPRQLAPWLLGAFALPVLAANLVAGEGQGLVLIWVMGSLALWPITRLRAAPALLMLLAVVIAAIGLGFLPTPRTYSLALNIMLAVSLLLFTWASNNASWRLPERSIRFFADYSFTLYLVHYTVIVHGHTLLDVPPWTGFVLTILISNVLSLALSHAGERRYPQLQAWLSRRN